MPPIVVGDQPIAHLARLHIGHAPCDQAVEELRRTISGEPQPPHVRNVEQPDCASHGIVLGHDRRVLHRHRPAGEIDQPPAVCGMPGMERRF